MDTIDVAAMRGAILHVAEKIVESEPHLTRIDSVIGDGDHGIGMKIGFAAVGRLLADARFDSINSLFKAVGIELIKTMGGASGVLFGSLFIGGLHELPGTDAVTVAQLARFLESSTASIQRRGKASAGDKTMLDALIPAVRALKRGADAGEGVAAALAAAAMAAANGAEATKGMLSRIGRAKKFGERTLGHPDAGAVSVSIVFHSLHDYFAPPAHRDEKE
jgi:dihydroxyacetone kinase-like protein